MLPYFPGGVNGPMPKGTQNPDANRRTFKAGIRTERKRRLQTTEYVELLRISIRNNGMAYHSIHRHSQAFTGITRITQMPAAASRNFLIPYAKTNFTATQPKASESRNENSCQRQAKGTITAFCNTLRPCPASPRLPV